MKKLVLFAFIFLTACSGQIPQVTVSPEATFTLPAATQTPEPTATPTSVYTPTPAKEIITNSSKVGFELGAQIVGQPEGVREVMDILPADGMSAEKQAEFEIKTNPQAYGFLEGEKQLAYIPTSDEEYQKLRIELQRTSNPADVIAVFGSTDFVWKINEMIDESGNPVFLNVGQIVEMKGGVPVNIIAVRSFASRLYNVFANDQPNGQHTLFRSGQYFTFISKDGTRAVIVDFAHTDDTRKKGYLFYMNADKKTVRWIYVEDFDESLSFVEAVH